MDRSRNILMRGNRVVCPLSDVVAVEVEDYFRVRVMNGMALILKDGRRFSVLLYDGRADAGLHAAAAKLAEFANVRVEVKTAGAKVREKKQ